LFTAIWAAKIFAFADVISLGHYRGAATGLIYAPLGCQIRHYYCHVISPTDAIIICRYAATLPDYFIDYRWAPLAAWPTLMPLASIGCQYSPTLGHWASRQLAISPLGQDDLGYHFHFICHAFWPLTSFRWADFSFATVIYAPFSAAISAPILVEISHCRYASFLPCCCWALFRHTPLRCC